MSVTEVVWLTKREAAARARVSVRTLDKAILAGVIRYAGGGHGVIVTFRPEWVDAWVESRGRGGTSAPSSSV